MDNDLSVEKLGDLSYYDFMGYMDVPFLGMKLFRQRTTEGGRVTIVKIVELVSFYQRLAGCCRTAFCTLCG